MGVGYQLPYGLTVLSRRLGEKDVSCGPQLHMGRCDIMTTVIVLIVVLLIVFTECSQYCEDVNYLESTMFSQMQACEGSHVRKSLRQNTECKPRPVIMRLPWPNNTDVQQVLTI